MKITHTESGQPYHLKPGAQLEIERTNLFFNEYGEHSNPMELPDTDHNRLLLGYPDMLGHNKKPSAHIPVTIEDDGYFMSCRQAILSAQRKNNISTSFYINEGEFLSRLSETSLTDIFKEEIIPGITTVQQGIDFCRSLVAGANPHYAIFPVLIDSGESYAHGYPKYKFINRFGYQVDNVWEDMIWAANKSVDFYNAVARTEVVNDNTIELTPGYYMSPFIRANYLLKRIMQYFGYSLNDNFFTQTNPFPDMVFINNCADALVNGTIRVSDLLPDCTCSNILNVFRKKFCCEFIPNEAKKTVDIKLFKDIIKERPQRDITPFLTSYPLIEYPEKYERLVISSEEQVSDADTVDTFKSVTELFNKYKSLTLDPFDGHFYRNGFKYGWIWNDTWVIKFQDKVGSSSLQYDVGSELKTKKIEVPDIQPEFRKIYKSTQNPADTDGFDSWRDKFLYIGPASFYNSTMVLNNTENQEKTDSDTSKDSSLKPMLAFFYHQQGYPRGTISNYKRQLGDIIFVFENVRLFDYTLCYNGEDGIFEKFYREFDNIHRNSLHKVKGSFLLSDGLKQSLSAHSPVLLSNQVLLINNFKYLLGGNNEPTETELYTIKLHEPVTTADPFTKYVSKTGYIWVDKSTYKDVTRNEYLASPYKDRPLEPVFPQPATADLAISGKQYYLQQTCCDVSGGGVFRHFSVWLECVKI